MHKMGFGFLRLPRTNAEDVHSTDMPLLCAMTDAFIASGGNYFDTAYTYLEGESERAIKDAVVARYPREQIRIADKLPCWKVTCQEDLTRYLQEQLERCGVSYFDVYLLHSINRENYEFCKQFDQFAFLQQCKEQGYAKAIGFSYHDDAILLEQVLQENPCVDYVQLQLNYLDWESPAIQAKQCYEVCVKYGKKVIVMEPCRGGALADLPEEAAALLHGLAPKRSMAAWAMAFAQGQPAVEVVLSGMSDMAQVQDNVQPFTSLSGEELTTLAKVADILRGEPTVACTACGYCVPHCPLHIAIPQYFALYNEYMRKPSDDWKILPTYQGLCTRHGAVSECVACGACARACPQRLPIPKLLKKAAEVLEQEI